MSDDDLNRRNSKFTLDSEFDQDDQKSTASPLELQAPMNSQRLGEKDSKLVNRSKCIVYLVLFLCAAISGAVAFFFLEEEDVRWQNDEFEEHAEELFESVGEVLKQSLQAAELLSAFYLSEVVNQEEFRPPNITYGTFGELGGRLADFFPGGQVMAVAPLVSTAEKVGFEAYATENQGWINQDLLLYDADAPQPGKIRDHIYSSKNATAELSAPLWQMYPTPTNASHSPIMFDLMSYAWFGQQWQLSSETLKTSVGSIHQDLDFLVDYAAAGRGDKYDATGPKFMILQPIVGGQNASELHALGMIVVSWAEYFEEVLEDHPHGIIAEVHDDCPTSDGDRYSFIRNADSVAYLGKNVDHLNNVVPSLFEEFDLYGDSVAEYLSNYAISDDTCGYVISVRTTEEPLEEWQREISFLGAFFIIAGFAVTATVFFVYTYHVQKRNIVVTSTAERSTAIVSSLFPKNVADQMMQEVRQEPTSKGKSTMQQAIQVLNDSGGPSAGRSALDSSQRKDPIADMFDETTIMFADIAGFTAWSAARQPSEVFTLLETVFASFDRIAEQRRVFKVETVGDCYVAACGVPDPRPDHALVMARYACDCRNAMKKVKRRLVRDLGPDTATLNMRFGLHSGPVTGGVIRGKNPRFQLFGDSMNKASRIESSGEKGRIHISEEMAKILMGHGKHHWVNKREDAVHLKGLGEVATYWLSITSEGILSPNSLATASEGATESDGISSDDEFAIIKTMSNEWNSTSHEVTWQTKTLCECLSNLVEARNVQFGDERPNEEVLQDVERKAVFGKAEPVDSIRFDDNIQCQPNGPKGISPLEPNILTQLEGFVREIADAYNPHAFHSAHHALNVAQSLQKLLQPFALNPLDPLTQFAVLVAALVHDVDHPGVSNMQLAQENDALARIYKTSFAERNSLDVFWNIFCQECFDELRRAVYQTPGEFEHFRQVIVQTVLATDIMDSGMQKDRVTRWEQCLQKDVGGDGGRLKTSMLEQLIQAADISHTMQDWDLYKLWNSRLCEEISVAYQAGREAKDPSEFWYQGEFGFFDFVVIPLATRLAQHPAFDKVGQELLRNANKNREEWQRKGEVVVMNRLR